MKRICKTFVVLLVVITSLLSFSITVGATETNNTHDGLVASIISDKDSYQANEDIELTFKVTNTNDFAVERISLEAIIPDGLKFKNRTDTKKDIISLGADESLEFSVTVIKEKNTSTTSSIEDTSTVTTEPMSSSNAEVIEPTATVSEETQPVSTEATETPKVETTTATITETNSVQATTPKSNQSVVSNNNSDNTTIKTGNNISCLILALVCLVCLAVAILAFRFRKQSVKYLSLVLCVCISISSIAVIGVTNTFAKETTKTMSFEVSKSIIVDSEFYIIINRVTYDEIFEETNSDFDTFDEIAKTTINIEKKYLNSDGYVKYEDTEKLFDDITEYLQTQKNKGLIDYFTQDTNSIFVKMKSGINYMYFPEYKDYLSAGSEKRIITFEPVRDTFEFKYEKFYADLYINFGSLCLGTENLDIDLIKNAELLSKELDYRYSSEDSYVNEEVTIDKLLNLPSNSFILFEGHGNHSENVGSVLWTDEKVNKNSIYNFGEDAIIYSKDKTIGVTYKFFENLPNNALENSTIYLGSCCSAKDDRLANSLLAKGANNVLGYSDLVSMRYEIGLRTFLTYGLTLKDANGYNYTLEEAYNFALSTYGGYDSKAPHAYLKILQGQGSLHGGVISSNDTPIADVKVSAYLKLKSGNKLVETVYTDSLGNFSMELQGGNYEVTLEKDGYKSVTITPTISNNQMFVLKDPIVMEKEENYRDDFINALLENEDQWYENWGTPIVYPSALMFTDLNFDGKLEFIMQYGGGWMSNCEADAYYYDGNNICLATSDNKTANRLGFENILTGYYDTQNEKYLLIGTPPCRVSMVEVWKGNYVLNFDGKNLSTDYYSSVWFNKGYDWTTENQKTQYYNGASGYANVDGITEISEVEYNKINEEKLKNLVDINMKREQILCSDWENYSDSEKRDALERIYDSFTYVKY